MFVQEAEARCSGCISTAINNQAFGFAKKREYFFCKPMYPLRYEQIATVLQRRVIQGEELLSN